MATVSNQYRVPAPAWSVRLWDLPVPTQAWVWAARAAGRSRAAAALSYEVILPAGQDPVTALAKLKMLEEEEPSLKVVWNEELKRINIQVMGELELEILEQVIERRFGMVVSFGSGGIIYKETIAAPVIGVGHYEPLRHYAEVQLLLEPLPARKRTGFWQFGK